MIINKEFFLSWPNTQKIGQNNCLCLKLQFDDCWPHLAKLKIIWFIEKYLGAKWAELRFLENKKARGSVFLPEKHWADHQHTSPNICLEIFSQLDNVMLESPHAESFQTQSWCLRVHLAASESLARFVIPWGVSRNGATAVRTVQVAVVPLFGQILPGVVPGAGGGDTARWSLLWFTRLLDARVRKREWAVLLAVIAFKRRELTIPSLCLRRVWAEITSGDLRGDGRNEGSSYCNPLRHSCPLSGSARGSHATGVTWHRAEISFSVPRATLGYSLFWTTWFHIRFQYK